jgi:small-conductance mechanosensitive channel
MAAAWVALVAGAAPAVAVALVHAILAALDLLPYRLAELFHALTMAAGVAGLIHGLAGGLLVPARASWRLAPLDDAAAARLLWIASSVGMLGAAAFAGGQILRVLMAPLSLTAAGGSLVAVAMALLTMLALKTVAGGIVRPADQVNGLVRWGWIIPALWGAAALSLVGTLAGYVAFGLFLVSQIVWASTVLSLLHVLLIVTDELFSTALKADAKLARAVGVGMGLSGAAVEQVGVVVSGLLRLLLIAVGVLLVLAPWGIESGDVLGWLQAAVIGFTVGQVTISPGAILGGLALFLLGILATRAVQRWLDAKFLPRTRLDVGLRTSIRTGVGYVGVLLAALIGISYVGLNLGNIAIVAGALSVGIGFGLQSIVNNFVSGLILLAERPIKAGDWIVVGSDQGFVKRINVRATEIETFDRASVIIPNSNLISGVVKNWMHGDTTGRVVIPVGVAYDSDPERVRSLLLGCAEDHASVLVYPEPRVFFKNFGESSLAFELMCFVGDVTQSARVASDLRFAILKRLRQDGIEIPFAQRELRLRDIDRLEAIAERFGRPRRPIPAAVPAE